MGCYRVLCSNTLDWAAGKAGFLEMLGTALLMYKLAGLVLLGAGAGENGYPRGLEKNV